MNKLLGASSVIFSLLSSLNSWAYAGNIKCTNSFSLGSTTIHRLSVNDSRLTLILNEDGETLIENAALKWDNSKNAFFGTYDEGDQIQIRLPSQKRGTFSVQMSWSRTDDESDHAGDWYSVENCVEQ